MKRLAVLVILVACGDDSSSPPDDTLEVTTPDGSVTTSLMMAVTDVGQQSSGTLRVHNAGTATTGPIALSFSGAAAGDFTIDNALTTCAGTALAGGASCDVAVTFRPLAAGLREATLVVASNPGGTLAVALSGMATMPEVHFTPTSFDFGQREIGTSAQTTITVENDGVSAAPITALAVTGAGYALAASTCGSVLAAGATCTATVSYDPSALGAQAGSLGVTTGGQTFSAPLAGRGARRIDVVVAGTGTGSVASTPAGIACGSDCTGLFEGAVTLTATPSATATTTWSVAGCTGTTCVIAAGLAPVTVTATFTEQGTPDLHFKPTPNISFGDVEVSTTAQFLVELRNDGTAPAPIGTFSVTGTGYTVGSNNCGATLAANASCFVDVSFGTSSLGIHDGTLTVMSGSQPSSVALRTHAKRRITVTRNGTGSGTVTSSVGTINCGVACSGLFDEDVTFTASPNAGSALASWSACAGTGPCTIPNGTAAVTLTATFALVPTSIHVTVAGDGIGEVLVREFPAGGAPHVNNYCTSTCTVELAPGDLIRIYATTPSRFEGITGACTSPANLQAAYCEFTAPPGLSTATVTFNKQPKELWTRMVSGYSTSSAEFAVAYDVARNIVVSTQGRLMKLSPTGTTVWERTLAVSGLATGPNGTIYVVSGTTVKKLDSAGNDLWTQPIPSPQATCGRCIAVAADGSVIVHASSQATRWDLNGNLAWTKPGGPFVLVDANNVIYTGINSVFRRYQLDGTELTALTLAQPPTMVLLDIAVIGDRLRTLWGNNTTVVKRSIVIATGAIEDNSQITVDIRDVLTPFGRVAASALGTFGELYASYRYQYANGPTHWESYVVNGAARDVIYGLFSLKEPLGAIPSAFAHANDGTSSQFVLAGRFDGFSTGTLSQGAFVQALAP